MTGGGNSTDDTEHPLPGYYVIKWPHQDPARVVSGPKDPEAAKSHAQFVTGNAKVMSTPALVNAIENQEYNVEWYDAAKKPRSLRTGGDQL